MHDEIEYTIVNLARSLSAEDPSAATFQRIAAVAELTQALASLVSAYAALTVSTGVDPSG